VLFAARVLPTYFDGHSFTMLSTLKEFVSRWARAPSDTKILLLGPTGSGKTSVLNLLSNFNFVVQHGEMGIESFKAFNDLSLENASEHKMASKTSGATVYEVDFCGKCLEIVDTPGFGDSRGMDMDKEHAQKIVQAVESVDVITMTVLVLNGRDARMNANLKYVLSSVTAVLPRDVLDNIVVVFTNTADPLDCNFDINELKEFFGKPITHSICIENPYCRVEKAKAKQGTLSLTTIAKSLQKSFEETSAQLICLFDILASLKSVPTHRFTNLYKEKQRIDVAILETLAAYDHQVSIDKELRKAEDEMQTAAHQKNLNSSFATTRFTSKWCTCSTSGHNTLCGASGCYSNCHAPCGLRKSMDKDIFRGCAAMGDGDTCTICGHGFQFHYHDEIAWEQIQESLPLVDESMKAAFERSKTVEERFRILKGELAKRHQESEENKLALNLRLSTALNQYQKLGTARSYRKILNQQLELLRQHFDALQGEAGVELQRKGLQQAIHDLEKQLCIVDDADKVVCGSAEELEWARKFMDFCEPRPTGLAIDQRYRRMAKELHPDKLGGDDAMFKKLSRAKEVLHQSSMRRGIETVDRSLSKKFRTA